MLVSDRKANPNTDLKKDEGILKQQSGVQDLKLRKMEQPAIGSEADVAQSAYGVGLLILLIAALPRILPQLMEPQAVPVVPISVYICGTMLNFFLHNLVRASSHHASRCKKKSRARAFFTPSKQNDFK
ncbi:hypothetical protein TELCIR_08199 [Teladorsagia circumcincta]|uniref:Uncharacterized protein n=1 Tax=Teladorsagia circumcincta TaxID=45464 RepID=A0A2G9UJP4_TELCI|nr:hypothetical protein TELCIR_08199 [Teladorsagia circumcincta]